MSNLFKGLTITIILLLSLTSTAKTYDENELKILVKKELERLLQSDGFLDSAIEKGINNFIKKRNQALVDELDK